MIYTCVHDDWNKIKKFQSFWNFYQNSHTQALAEILKIDSFWGLSSFTVKLWKSVKMIKFNCKHDFEMFSSLMEQNEEVLVIFKFWPKSHKAQALAEILKID